MPPFPADIFTEPADVDPDTLANLGPLRRLAGSWRAEKGVDVNPKAAGPERRVFIERNDLAPIDPQTNGPQLFYGLSYHIHIDTAEEDITFHDQTGYWLWEAKSGLVLQTLAIPRGQVLLASGQAKADDDRIVVTATRGKTDYGICSNDFLEYAFRTESYRLEIDFLPDGSWHYLAETVLDVRGEAKPFTHHDENTMRKIAEPEPNPLMKILAARAAKAGKTP